MKMDSKYSLLGVNKKKQLAGKVVKTNKPKMGKLFGETHNGNKHTNGTQKPSLLEHRRSLPVYKVRKRLLEEIKRNDALIVIGETGSGKTTQIPQLIHECRLEGSGMVGVTQPRRVAAITVAMRVAQEMNSTLGGYVGYTVRFEDLTSNKTKVKFMTDGMLLREAMLDSLLMSYSIVILDEAHERTVSTDVLFGIIKRAQSERKHRGLDNLKILVMSATMNVETFSKYFNNCPIIYLEGRTFPVTIFHMKTQPNDYQQAALCSIFQLHKDMPISHDILVFLTGQEEIETLAYNIRKLSKEVSGGNIKVYPLFASLPQQQQLEVFRPVPLTMRKIILATNIAETSITIPNIKCVIDTGMVKIRKCFGWGEALRVEHCSQAACLQRTGRAGRESPGRCYRLFTVASMESRSQHSLPPILCSPLSPTLLQLLALKVNLETFDLIDKPPMESIKQAVHLLKELGAISGHENLNLTPVGKKMAVFPIDPKLSKAILSANENGCLEEILSIVALLSCDGIFHNTINNREEALRAKTKFISSLGDHITLLNVYREFAKVENKKKWCSEHFLKYYNLNQAMKIRNQLVELCNKFNMRIVSCENDTDKIMKSLMSGLFVNIAWTFVKNGSNSMSSGRYHTASSLSANIHPSSVLHGISPPPKCVLFTELINTQSTYISILSVVEPHWLDEIAPEFSRKCRIAN